MGENVRIPFEYFNKVYNRYLPEYQNAFLNANHNNRLLELERQMVDYNASKHCIMVKNSRDALILICLGLGLKAGDEVLTSAINDMEIIQVLLILGLKPVLVEVRKETFHLEPFDISNRLTERTKAIIVSDIFGQIADYQEITKILDSLKRSIFIIEDARQAFGAFRNSIKAGRHGMVGYTSWKLGGIGEVAMCITNDQDLGNKLRILRNGGAQIRGYYEDLSVESYPSSLMIEMMLIRLKYWDKEASERKQIVMFYQRQLEAYERSWKTAGPWKLMTFNIEKGLEPNWCYYVMRVERRNEILAYLREHDIESNTVMNRPLHLQPLMMRLGYRKGVFPIAEKVAGEILMLPCEVGLEEWQQRTWITVLKKFYKV